MNWNWPDIAHEVGKFAPEVGTALAGPAGAVVGTAVAAALGTTATPDAVLQAVKNHPDVAVKLKSLEVQLKESRLKYETVRAQQGGLTVRAALAGKSVLERDWRAILMLVIAAIILNNYIVAPYVNALTGGMTLPEPTLPMQLWDLMKIGVGGYVVGEGGARIAAKWKGTSKQ